jgi:hypothetical protein
MADVPDVTIVNGLPTAGDGTVATLGKVIKQEDAASASADWGMPILVKRADTPAATSGTDGDYEHVQSKDGRLLTTPFMYPFRAVGTITRPADVLAYAAGDAISDSTTAPTTGGFTLSSVARISGGFALVTGCTIITDNDPATRLSGEVLLFNTAFTNVNDNTAFVVSDAEALTYEGAIPFSMYDMGNNGVAEIQNLSKIVKCVGSADLRFAMRARNAYTPASAEVFTVILTGMWLN